MELQYVTLLAAELQLGERQVEAAASLLDEGATVPFIARYRKEATGSLDEVAITAIRDRLVQLRELDRRRESVLQSLVSQGVLTEELKGRVLAAATLAELEDIYLPYRPRRRTRATMAREKGLAPLADLLLAQDPECDPLAAAAAYVDPEKGVETAEEALAGARDIVAEQVSENAAARAEVRQLFAEKAVFRTRVVPGQETEARKYRDYFDWEEPVARAPSHRILAMRRGENELGLILRVAGPEEECLSALERRFLKGEGAAAAQVRLAIGDGHKRLLAPSMETEVRAATKARADAEAIRVFADNLRQLLLAAPLGQKRVLALDPGFRTGCKLVCLDAQGELLHTDVVYPDRHPAEAGARLLELCRRHRVEAIAIGNGTAGRETERFVRGLDLPAGVAVVMVNESGASVYSASEAAREEFPDQDLTVRGAVSIGRRLTDPLAELVKIDPKAIGVGQYQHDVDQGALKVALDDVVTSCVNRVGVEINTASQQLLSYVSGLGPQLARNIVEHRRQHGPFRSRAQLKEVPRLGPRAFELAAGFLRVRGGEHPLDGSAVHPERYALVARMAADLGCTVAELMEREDLRQRLDLERYCGADIGLPTLRDILAELARPGRDPREGFEAFQFAEGVEKLEDLAAGMELPGIVTNVTAFGAFVDVGVHQDGLVHVSQLADRYVKDPNEVVRVQQRVRVRVLEVDLERRRISLSMRPPGRERPAAGAR
ncbi:MAG: Tex family protein [Gemmatimonadota bacterium]